MRNPFSPASSIRRPAASPGGFVNTEPAFWPPGWCSRRQRTISSMRAADAAGSPTLEPVERFDHHSSGADRRVPVGEIQRRPFDELARPRRDEITTAATRTSAVSAP